MAAWSDAALAVGVALVGGGIGIAGTLAATRAAARTSASERQAAQQAARVERVGAALGPIGTLLIDTNPDRIAFQGAALVQGTGRDGCRCATG